MLLASQKLEIIKTAKDYGFTNDKLKFIDFVDGMNLKHTKIELIDTIFYFDIKQEYEFYCSYSPGEGDLRDDIYTQSLADAVVRVKQWIKYCDRELSAINEILSLSEELFKHNNQYSNEKFTETEREEIDSRFKKLESRISQLQLQPEKLKKINITLEEINEKTKTLGKIDWRNAFAGAILGTLIPMALNPEVAKQVLSAINTIIFAGESLLQLAK